MMLLFSISSFAQISQTFYCEMIGSGNFSGNKIKVSFDFGNQGFSYKSDDDNQIVDDKGEPIKFSSMIDALNYMSLRGWRLSTAYSATIKGMGAQETYRYILMKTVTDPKMLMEGIALLGEHKEQNREQQIENEKKKAGWDDMYR